MVIISPEASMETYLNSKTLSKEEIAGYNKAGRRFNTAATVTAVGALAFHPLIALSITFAAAGKYAHARAEGRNFLPLRKAL